MAASAPAAPAAGAAPRPGAARAATVATPAVPAARDGRRTTVSPGGGASATAAPAAAAAPPVAAGAPATTVDRLWRLTIAWWAVMLFGYALFDKGFAYLHVPGTPLFIGELSLLPVLALVALDTRSFVGHRLVPLGALAAYCCWAALRLVQSLDAYRIEALRDAALWYYAAVAVLVLAWFRRGPQAALGRSLRFFEVLTIPLLVWTPVAVLAERAAGRTAGPSLPITGIPILSHKPSNLAPLLTMAALLAWFGAYPRFGQRARTIVFTAALVDLAAVGTQTRGGFLAGLAGLAVAAAVLPRGRRATRVAPVGLAICLTVFGLSFALDLKVGADGRDVSVRQLTNNMLSVVGLDVDDRAEAVRGTLDGNAEWRETLWSNVWHRTFATDREIIGWGFGPNLGDEVGFENQLGDGSLRSPHNSHLSVFARLGAIGATLWATVWITWSWALLRLARWRRCPDPRLPVAAAVLLGGLVALHINAYFDPAYESPQAGAWMWAVFGAGCGLLLVRRALLALSMVRARR